MSKSIFIVDNYDSFTYNLVHLIEQLNLPYCVRRNDDIDFKEVDQYTHILIGPGPGLPESAGQVQELLQHVGKRKSVLGVCLGFQAMLEHTGLKLSNLSEVQHGAIESISVSNEASLYCNLPATINVGRYHSWGILQREICGPWNVTAVAEDGCVMSAEHTNEKWFGVQFHPESIMTDQGLEMLQNWMSID